MSRSDIRTRIAFVTELTRRLHEYGTAAPRLEAAVTQTAHRLGLDCQIWSSPTAVIMSFSALEDGYGHPEVTEVLRLNPGSINLRQLCEVDSIAEAVGESRMSIDEGFKALRAARSQGLPPTTLFVLCFGLTAACVAILLRTSWADVGLAGLLGVGVGWLANLAERRPGFGDSMEAVTAFIVATVAVLVASLLAPVSVKLVAMASLIVLLPGLTLTLAVQEVATGHLVSGTARFSGAMATLLKLTFGAVTATQIMLVAGMEPLPGSLPSVPQWLDWVALLAASFSFAVLFNAAPRDYPVVMLSAWLGYGLTRFGGDAFGAEFGVFIAGFVVSLAANAYARLFNRPGALMRVSGIILLVPGSVGFRGLSFVFEKDVLLGLDAVFTLITLLVSLVAGLLFGNMLIPPRRAL